MATNPSFNYCVYFMLQYICEMCSLVELDLVSSVLGKRLAGKNINSPNQPTNQPTTSTQYIILAGLEVVGFQPVIR